MQPQGALKTSPGKFLFLPVRIALCMPTLSLSLPPLLSLQVIPAALNQIGQLRLILMRT